METPGSPDGPTALVLLSETWQGLPTLTRTGVHSERKKERTMYVFVCLITRMTIRAFTVPYINVKCDLVNVTCDSIDDLHLNSAL